MSPRETIQKLIDDHSVESVLRRRSDAGGAVRALQTILFELGFEDELKWQKYGADGDYGGSTTGAVKAFAGRNGLTGDGQAVTEAVAGKLIARYDTLDDLRHLHNAVAGGKVEQLFYRGSPHATAVVALQTLLNELGFGEELNWAKYGADGKYGGGTTRTLKAFAGQAGIQSDGRRCSVELARKIIDRLQGYFGAKWAKDAAPIERRSGDFTIRESVEGGKARVYVSLAGRDQARFTKYKSGLYAVGNQKPLDFINAARSSLNDLGLTDSAINIMVAVSENEGNLDAVNTWDNAFMTFGMFQWTAGTGGDPGELPALVKKIKDTDDAVFRKYYGQYGLDIVNTGKVTGYFTINGKKIATAADKEPLRTHECAYYFWLSGRDPVVQSVEIEHALSRLATFYRSNAYRVKGYHIADLVTSEYGVGLLLDNHVNRPAYVKPCLEKAMDRTRLSDPDGWGSEEEGKLIDAYLEIRETHGRYPMTHARKRAEVTRKYLVSGTISDERDSFVYDL
jgi:peptidoglycan hydrolase-like protein with peptidoglycan-binding domain